MSARLPGTLSAFVFLAALAMLLVSVSHGWRGIGIVSAAIVLTVTWETSMRQRQEGAWRPRHPDRPWKRGPE